MPRSREVLENGPVGFRVQTTIEGPSRTKQAPAEETDINFIVKRHTQGARVPLNPRTPHYGDFSKAVDLTAAHELWAAAEDDFMSLPADVRTAANNDPVRFLEMLASEQDTQELIDAGLAVEEPPEGAETGGPPPPQPPVGQGGGPPPPTPPVEGASE